VSPGAVWRTATLWARVGIVLVGLVSAGCGAYVSFVLIRPPSPLSDASSAPIWTLVFPLIVAVLLGTAGGVVTSVRSCWRRAPAAGAIATVPASVVTIATLELTMPKGDNDGLWALIYPTAVLWAAVLFALAASASLLTRRLEGGWGPTVFATCLGLTGLAAAPGPVEADRTASTSWVTLRNERSHLTRAEAAELLDQAQRHAASVDGSEPVCGFQMTGTVVFTIVCGPTSAPLYPYGWGSNTLSRQDTPVLTYGIERPNGAWQAVPPPREQEVPEGYPPATDGPYVSTTFGPVLDLDGNPVALGG
jgi:hypothetical protein